MTAKRVLPKGVPDKDATLEELFAHLKEHGRLDSTMFPRNDVIEVFIKASTPVPIVFAGDLHIGSPGTDYDQLQRDIDFIAANPELKLILAGDTVDNFGTGFKSAQPVLDQACSPKMQKMILTKVVERLSRNKSLLFSLWGNHEGRDENTTGDNPFAAILSKAAPYFDGQGIVILLVGKTRATAQRYVLVLAHKPPSRSANDKLLGAKRLYASRAASDVVCTAHYHDPAITQDMHYTAARDAGLGYGGKRILLALGTYLREDVYSKRHWNGGSLGAPTVIFWPDQHRTEVTGTAEDALIYLRGLAAQDKEKA